MSSVTTNSAVNSLPRMSTDAGRPAISTIAEDNGMEDVAVNLTASPERTKEGEEDKLTDVRTGRERSK